jgi:hypothetical protein
MIDHWLDKQQLLIYDSFYPLNNNITADIFAKMMSSSPTANPEINYLAFHHKEILQIAEELYDQLLRVAINNTIYPPKGTATQQPNVIKTNKCEN